MLLSAIVNASEDAILSKTLDGIITTWNPAAERMFGYTATEIIGKPKMILFPLDRLQGEKDILDRLRQGIATDRFETVRLHKDGTLLNVSVSISPIRDGHGQVIGAATIARNITQQKRAEEEMRLTQERLEEAQRVAHVGSSEYDVASGKSTWSKEQFRLFNIDPASGEPSYDQLMQCFHPDDVAIVQKAIETGVPFEIDVRVLKKDASFRWINIIALVDYDAQGKPARMYGTSMDVTERKKAEEKIRLSQERLEEAQRVAHIGSWEFDVVSGRITWSKEHYRLFDLDPASGEPSYDRLLQCFHPDDVVIRNALVQKAIEGGIPFETEMRVLKKDGSFRWIRTIARADKDAQGKVVRLFGTNMDVTERKEAEQQATLLSTVAAEAMNSIVITDPQEHILYVNPAFEHLSGFLLEEVQGLRPADVLQGENTDATTRRQVRAALDAQEPVTVEILNYRKNGTPYWIEMHITPVRDTTGTVSHFVAIQNDVTSRKQAEQQRQEVAERLRVSEERYALSVEGSQNGLWDWDIPTGTTQYSARWEQMLGYAEGEFPTNAEAAIAQIHPDDLPRFYATTEAYFNRESDLFEVEFRLRHKDGSYRWILSRGVGRFDGEGKLQRIAGSHMDITERKRLTEQLQVANEWQKDAIEQLTLQQAELREANDRLEALATTDSLTGLKNHRALHERLRQEYDRALRYNTPFSLLMLDVDNFKPYNDTYGHPAGDVVLRQVAQVLRETARTCDIVARYGGEEFVVLLPEADVEEAKTVAERFRNAVETVAWPERGITVSIGATTLTPTSLHPDALLADADVALYRSKHQGRNCVTHTNDVAEGEGLDTEAAGWADALFQKLLAIQKDQAGEVSEQVRESLLHAYDATIISWSRILDLKDKETEGHSERVTEWMVRLMQYLGFNAQEIRLARWGALLHDIGKIAVPDHILHKPGSLTDEEWVIMRQHTSIAYEMLQPIEFLGSALEIPYCHHEKWDGSGYPRGLKGDEIPLTARLFAVIDVYDALTSDRPYRKAWTAERVKAHLREQAGTHFDPRAVDAFLNMLADDCVADIAA